MTCWITPPGVSCYFAGTGAPGMSFRGRKDNLVSLETNTEMLGQVQMGCVRKFG